MNAVAKNKFYKILLWTFLAFLACAAIVFAARYSIVTNEAYAVAVRHAKSSVEISEKAGPIKTVGLSWFGSSDIENSEINGSMSGSAILALNIDGEKSQFLAQVILTRDASGKWVVTETRLCPSLYSCDEV